MQPVTRSSLFNQETGEILKKKTLILIPILLGIGIGVGLGLGYLSKPASKINSNPNEISISFSDDEEQENTDDVIDVASEETEIIFDSDALLPAAPIDADHPPVRNTKPAPAASSSSVAAVSRPPEPKNTKETAAAEQKKTETAAAKSTAESKVQTAPPAAESRTAKSQQSSREAISEEDIQSDISGYYVDVKPEQIASDYKKRLPIRVGKYQTLTDFTYSKNDGFTYHIKTNRDDITEKMKSNLPGYACENKQVQIFMQYVNQVNFQFTNASDVLIHTVSIPKSVCTAKLKNKYKSSGNADRS